MNAAIAATNTASMSSGVIEHPTSSIMAASQPFLEIAGARVDPAVILNLYRHSFQYPNTMKRGTPHV